MTSVWVQRGICVLVSTSDLENRRFIFDGMNLLLYCKFMTVYYLLLDGTRITLTSCKNGSHMKRVICKGLSIQIMLDTKPKKS